MGKSETTRHLKRSWAIAALFLLPSCSMPIPILGDISIKKAHDQERTCSKIAGNMDDLQAQSLAMVTASDSMVVIRNSATGYGKVVIWPVLRTLAKDQDREPLQAIEQQHRYLENEAAKNECFGPRSRSNRGPNKIAR